MDAILSQQRIDAQTNEQKLAAVLAYRIMAATGVRLDSWPIENEHLINGFMVNGAMIN